MAKKKTPAAKSSASKCCCKSGGKASSRSMHDHEFHEHIHDEHCCEAEVALDDTEKKTIDKVLDSAKFRLALETEVSAALTAAVRKVCRQHGAPLTVAQAKNVAMVLFGD
jgi:hypothetical protein